MTSTGDEEKKKKEAPKKKPASSKKKKENKNPNQSDDDEIRATHADTTNMHDDTVAGAKPLLESTTHDLNVNVAKKKQPAKSAAAKKNNMEKFNYVHRLSVIIIMFNDVSYLMVSGIHQDTEENAVIGEKNPIKYFLIKVHMSPKFIRNVLFVRGFFQELEII